MLEIPEAIVVSQQLNQTVKGKRIKSAVAGASPHKFTWYFGEPSEYGAYLGSRIIEKAEPCGGRIEISAEGAVLHFCDGVNLRYHEAGSVLPEKHQLLIAFEDGPALTSTVAMYGGLFAFPAGAMDDNFYYRASKEAVSPLSDAFDYNYFLTLCDEKGLKMSAKAFLATEQRIPGLGNGVLHDILLNAKIHPKRKVNTLSEQERRVLFDSVKFTLAEMRDGGGRDTERDLFGNLGGYKTKLSSNNKALICPHCGSAVVKEAYLGGSIYYCTECQTF